MLRGAGKNTPIYPHMHMHTHTAVKCSHIKTKISHPTHENTHTHTHQVCSNLTSPAVSLTVNLTVNHNIIINYIKRFLSPCVCVRRENLLDRRPCGCSSFMPSFLFKQSSLLFIFFTTGASVSRTIQVLFRGWGSRWVTPWG